MRTDTPPRPHRRENNGTVLVVEHALWPLGREPNVEGWRRELFSAGHLHLPWSTLLRRAAQLLSLSFRHLLGRVLVYIDWVEGRA